MPLYCTSCHCGSLYDNNFTTVPPSRLAKIADDVEALARRCTNELVVALRPAGVGAGVALVAGVEAGVGDGKTFTLGLGDDEAFAALKKPGRTIASSFVA